MPLILVGTHHGKQLFDEIDEARIYREYDIVVYRCPTCDGISVFGDYADIPSKEELSQRRLYPHGGTLLPEPHLIASRNCVPERIVRVYEEIWPLRYLAPNAFAGQIRRALEYICIHEQAQGKTLFDQLKDLVARGTFPGSFAEITDLMRRVGNLGAHAMEKQVDLWDAELLDDFFRSVVEYVYVIPSKIARLKQRISHR